MLLFVFAFSFHLLLGDQVAFKRVPQALVKTVVWMIGDLGYDDTFLNDDYKLLYPIMVNILFVVFVTTIGGFIVNLIITQPTDKLDRFRDSAAFHQAASKCKLFLKYDVCFQTYSRYKKVIILTDKDYKDFNFIIKKLLMIDAEKELAAPPDPIQLKLEELSKQILDLLNHHIDQREEIREIKHQLKQVLK